MQDRYEAGKRGARQVQGCKVVIKVQGGIRQVEGVKGRYKGCEAGTSQVKGVRGRYKTGKRGARQVQGR